MANLKPTCNVSVTINVTLNEDELAALDALAGYGTEEFLRIFYDHMGRHYLEPHEAGLRSLFASVRNHGSLILRASRIARDSFNANKPHT